MRVFHVAARRFFLQFERGEEIKERLRAFAEERGIGAGSLRGLGAAERVELDFYHLSEKRHEAFSVEEGTEVASLLGNLTRGEDGRAVIHLHATLGRRDGSTVGGHVERLVVGATLEVDLEVLPGTLRRELDPAVGLPLPHSYARRSP
ncbi:MAG: PPC domain-containing DNA-binding protein [Gemmatimonadota bacterium]